MRLFCKCSVLRIEATINDPHEFKVFGTVRHHDGTESEQWKPMGKSISNLYRYAEVSKACNLRLIDAMTDIVPVRSIQEEIGKVCSGKTVKGRHISGFDTKKRSSKTSRILKKLRQHGLIKKVPHSRRYHVTSKGRRIMGALIKLYQAAAQQLANVFFL